MIVGIGLDVVETARVARALAKYGKRFEDRVFTAAELAECAGRADRVQALAGRFALDGKLPRSLPNESARGRRVDCCSGATR